MLNGQSPAGVIFTLTFYRTAAAAKAAGAKKNAKTTAVVEDGVIDFRGNPSPVRRRTARQDLGRRARRDQALHRQGEGVGTARLSAPAAR